MLKIPRLMFKPLKGGKKLRLRVERSFHTTPKLNSPRKLAQLKKLQGDYQVEDGRPVFLKAGFTDRVLYTTTLLLCVVGLVNVLLVIYDQAKPPGWRKKC